MSQSQPPTLVADIGGTHARFAWLDDGKLRDVSRVLCADFPRLEDAAGAYLKDTGFRAERAAIAVATTLTGGRVSMTNHVWAFEPEAVRSELGLTELRIINDFTALALAVPELAEHERIAVGGGTAAGGAPIALLGPGTGLGASALVPAAGHWVPLHSEGGHVTCPATSAEEEAVLTVLRTRYGNVSAERVLSGPGLVNLHQGLAQVRDEPIAALEPIQITAAARAKTDPLCVDVLDLFFGILGTVAGNLVLTLGARGGLYLGGGILPSLRDELLRSAFRQRFASHGRLHAYLTAVPCYLIIAKHPALRGAARAFDYPPEAIGLRAAAPHFVR